MYLCSATDCKNSTKKGFTMHFFPKDPEYRQKWIEKINRPDWQPSMFSTLCEVHFDTSMWSRNKKQTLKPNAIPTIFNDEKTKNNPKKIKKTPDVDPVRHPIKTEIDSDETIDDFPTQSQNEHSYASLNNETFSLKKRIDIYEKRFTKLLLRNRYYKLKLRNCNQKITQLETQLETLKNNDQYLNTLRIVFNDDQIDGLKRKSVRFMRWSDDTLKKALKLRYACGEAGYDELLTQHFPLPSIRSLNRYTNLSSECDETDMKEDT